MFFYPINRDFLPDGLGESRLNELQVGNATAISSGLRSRTAEAACQEWIGDMANHFKPKNDGSFRSVNCMAQSQGEKDHPGNSPLDITAMIRSLQRTEGLSDCFRRDIPDCDEQKCAWRQYCIAPPED